MLTIKHRSHPKLIHIFPDIDFTRSRTSQYSHSFYFRMVTHIPIVRDNIVYLIPLAQEIFLNMKYYNSCKETHLPEFLLMVRKIQEEVLVPTVEQEQQMEAAGHMVYKYDYSDSYQQSEFPNTTSSIFL